MKKVMVCPKNTGNTHKVCDYVSRKLGIELKVVDGTTGTNLEDCDVVILSSGVYGNHVHENLQTWINSISDGDIKPNAKFYVFFTWFGRGKSDQAAFGELKDLLENKGLKLEDNYMKCFGKGMVFVRKSHPNEEDCENILSWVKGL